MISFLEKKRAISIILTLIIALEIFYFSSLTGGSVSSGGISLLPLLYHFIVFFLFGFFLFVSIKGKENLKLKYLILVLVISVIYALLDEFHQTFIPGRDANFLDIATDTAGILSSICLYSYVQLKKIK